MNGNIKENLITSVETLADTDKVRVVLSTGQSKVIEFLDFLALIPSGGGGAAITSKTLAGVNVVNDDQIEFELDADIDDLTKLVITATVDTAPEGASMIFDYTLDGLSIFYTQTSRRPEIANENFTIIGVTSGANGDFTITGDQTLKFPVGKRFSITGSTGNDFIYEVLSLTYAGNTTIEVSQVFDATVDGQINTIQAVSGAPVLPSAKKGQKIGISCKQVGSTVNGGDNSYHRFEILE